MGPGPVPKVDVVKRTGQARYLGLSRSDEVGRYLCILPQYRAAKQ